MSNPETTMGPGSCPAEYGGQREDCDAWPACACDQPRQDSEAHAVIDRVTGAILAASPLSGDGAKAAAVAAVHALFGRVRSSTLRHISRETMDISAGYQADRSGMGIEYGYELRGLAETLEGLAQVIGGPDA